MVEPIPTERLILRQWKEGDLLPFYKLNSDPRVMEFFPKLLSRKERLPLILITEKLAFF